MLIFIDPFFVKKILSRVGSLFLPTPQDMPPTNSLLLLTTSTHPLNLYYLYLSLYYLYIIFIYSFPYITFIFIYIFSYIVSIYYLYYFFKLYIYSYRSLRSRRINMIVSCEIFGAPIATFNASGMALNRDFLGLKVGAVASATLCKICD